MVCVSMSLILSACSVKPKIISPETNTPPRKLVIFFDGTANDEASDTNIKKIHSLISLQNKKDVGTFYIEGVGANGKIAGMMTGWGTGHRVKLAYGYLLKNYQEGDQIYLFGFSRGAYSARILASLLYHAGLPATQLSDKVSESDIAEKLYDAFKGDMLSTDRRSAINSVIKEYNIPKLKTAYVEFMGLWDTVEALGTPNYEEDFIKPNRRYGDQLCNVKKAAHALSLDDNRARIFTPILLTKKHLLEQCDKDINGNKWSANNKSISHRLNTTVEEVWFTGAHADVGGGYQDALLSGVSLNWMIRQLTSVDQKLLSPKTEVRSDPEEAVHDPEKGPLWGTLYRKRWRNFMNYAANSPYNNGRLKIHHSVITRLQKPERLKDPNSKPRESQWRLVTSFPSCFGKQPNAKGGYNYKRTAQCKLDKVDTRQE